MYCRLPHFFFCIAFTFASALRVEVVAYGILPSTDSRLAAISIRVGSASSGNSTGASASGTGTGTGNGTDTGTGTGTGTGTSAGAVMAEAVSDIVAVTTLTR
jgi:hypothetical protein